MTHAVTNPPAFAPCQTLDSSPWGPAVRRILAAALEAVEPGHAVARHLRRVGDELEADGKRYDLSRCRRIWVVGAGKAAAPMAAQIAALLGERLSGGVVIVKEGHTGEEEHLLPALTVLEAGHPLPDERGLRATERLLALIRDSTEDDLVLCLLSGGGSALLTAPLAGVTLRDIQALTAQLLACGANIEEINILRRHLDRVKGGGLARVAWPAQVLTVVLSDVVGNPLEAIASGPTAPDPSTFEQAWDILVRYDLLSHLPPAILAHLERGRRGEVAETPKPGDPLFERVHHVIVGDNYQAAQAALTQAKAEGLNSALLTTYLQGEACQAGRFLAAVVRQMAASGEPLPRPACLVAGGETTVTLHDAGYGGRNQEVALAAALDLDGVERVLLVTLATDGGDGPTDAAGAVVDGQTCARAAALGLNPLEALRRHDSYPFFAALGDLLRTGPTRTNVNDLAFLFAF